MMGGLTITAVVITLVLGLLVAIALRKPKHLRSLQKKHVVVTDGSTSIGFSLAKVCLSEGAFVTLMSRTHSKLLPVHDTLTQKFGFPTDHILLKAVDVSDGAAVSLAIKESFAWRAIDVLICNMGQKVAGALDQVKAESLETWTRTNMLGCVHPIHAVLPLIKSRSTTKASAIVIVGSLSCLFSLNSFNTFSSTQFALKGLAEYLMIELMPYNICVSLACPGCTETSLPDEIDKVCKTTDLVLPLCFHERKNMQSPDDVAVKIMEGAKKGDLLITTNLAGYLAGVLGRGCIPADSFTRAVTELLLSVPVRIISFFLFLRMQRVLQMKIRDKLKESNQEDVIAYVHSIDDSAADDDANLDLWSH